MPLLLVHPFLSLDIDMLSFSTLLSGSPCFFPFKHSFVSVSTFRYDDMMICYHILTFSPLLSGSPCFYLVLMIPFTPCFSPFKHSFCLYAYYHLNIEKQANYMIDLLFVLTIHFLIANIHKNWYLVSYLFLSYLLHCDSYYIYTFDYIRNLIDSNCPYNISFKHSLIHSNNS